MTRNRTVLGFVFVWFALGVGSLPASSQPFRYEKAGDLLRDSGIGIPDTENYAPGMRFPLLADPAYANSQVFGYGGGTTQCGGKRSNKGWKDTRNYAYPWRDNFCERFCNLQRRTMEPILCRNAALKPAPGHLGQDIRAADPGHNHAVVAVAKAFIGRDLRRNDQEGHLTLSAHTDELSNTDLAELSDTNIIFVYEHLSLDRPQFGLSVRRGDPLGTLSNASAEGTTMNLHFEIKLAVRGEGYLPHPPYVALVESYKRLLRNAP